MQETITLGYRIQDIDGIYVVRDGERTLTFMEEPQPCSLGEAYRTVGAYLEEHPHSVPPRMVKVEQVRELTPLECTSRELAQRLLSLTAMHGLDLGLTPAQVETQITKELVALGSTLAR